MFFRVTAKSRVSYRYIYLGELVYVIVEAEKSHNLPSANWRLRKAHTVIQTEFKGLRTRGADGVNPSPKEGDRDVPEQA